MAAEQVAAQAAAQEAVAPAKPAPRKLSMVVMSGDFDRLFGAFVIGTGAAAMNMEVTMFFTFWGLRALKKNVSTGKGLFGRMVGVMYGGDINRAGPSKFNFGGVGRWMFKKMMRDKNVTSLPELRDMAVEMGVTMYGCQMSMDVMEIDRGDMIDGVTACVGVAKFLSEAVDSDITLFI
jgi:peroxiredoxin family protein